MIIGYMTFNALESALDTAGTKFKYFEFSKGNFFNTLGSTGEELTCKYCPVAKGEMFRLHDGKLSIPASKEIVAELTKVTNIAEALTTAEIKALNVDEFAKPRDEVIALGYWDYPFLKADREILVEQILKGDVAGIMKIIQKRSLSNDNIQKIKEFISKSKEDFENSWNPML